ncbi:hypothetical protein IAR50_000649 [Cryptococcus sp. DSM 104548]
MRPPGLPWAGFNFLRSTGVVFIIWAFVAQFIALANDFSAKSIALTTTSIEDSSSPLQDQLTTASISSDSQEDASPSPSSITTSSLALATSGTIIASGPSVSPANATAEDAKSGKGMIKRAGEMENGNQTAANFGLSSIPDQSGGVAFAVISRLMMAVILGLLVFGQFGWPEMFLYRYVPWLGPQSTPVWLGLVEVVVAIENLRVYAKSVVLISAWGLFVVGLLNSLIGLALLYLGRRLPKSPPPPLYFNMSQRLLFWTPLPPCYRELFDKAKSPEKLESQEDRVLPPSNAQEIDLDEEEEDEEKSIGANHRPVTRSSVLTPGQTLMGRPKAPHQDVTRGGYPTFSGGGPTNPSTQVPTGILERAKDGRILKFVNENGQEVGPPQTSSRSEEMGSSGASGDGMKGGHVLQDQLPPRSYSKKKAPTALNLNANAKVVASRPTPESPLPSSPGRPAPRHVHLRDEVWNSLSRIDSQRQSALSSVSTISAAKDLGPRFPLPPTRSFSANSVASLESPKAAVARAPYSATASSMAPVSVRRDRGAPPRELSLPKPRDKGRRKPDPTAPFIPKSPAKSVSEPPLTAPPVSPDHNQSDPSIPRPLPQHKRSATLQSHLSGHPGHLPLRSSMAPSALTRSESSRSAKGTRLAHGVRFMDKVEEKSPSPPCTGQTGTTTATTFTSDSFSDDDGITAELRSPARRGVRVPGTNFQLPALSWPGLGSSRRESFASDVRESVASDSSLEGSTTSSSDDSLLPYRRDPSKDDQESRRARPKTVAILGGGYLDGGKEITRNRRPSSMSFDSRSSRGS